MKNTKLLLTLFIGVLVFFGCQKDEIDRAALTDFPPGILSIFPSDASKVVLGGFDIVVHFVDGTISPLSTATVALTDSVGNELASATETLSGTADSLYIAGDSFGADSLGVGIYNMSVSVGDSKGQSTERNISFELTASLYPSIESEIYIAGGFNGWGADPLELVGPNTWEIKEINLEGGEWKLKNTVDWTDVDWGDPDCDGILEITSGGGPNSNCGHSGVVNLRFNDETLKYTIESSVTFEGNLKSLYLHTSGNNFEGDQLAFAQTESNIWVLNEAPLKPDENLRFSEEPYSMGKIYGDAEGDGIAEEFGPNIVFTEAEAFYKVTFNDATLAYSFEYVRDVPQIESLGIIGSGVGGWTEDIDMTDEGNGVYTITIAIADGAVKFRTNNDWAVNWGGTDFPEGVGTQGGPDIMAVPGYYNVTFNANTGAYSFEIVPIGVLGSATPTGWDADTDMKHLGNGIYRIVLGLNDGFAKFRANDDWDINWGSSDFPIGLGTQGGPDIPISKGLYTISVNAVSGEYSFGPATVGIIGSATPGDWVDDTDMEVDADNPAILRGTFELSDGEAKFRANNKWEINWGAGDFPTGVGTIDGSNIPVSAGTYNVTLNVNTGEYIFE